MSNSLRTVRLATTGVLLLMLSACGATEELAKARKATIVDAGGATLEGKVLEGWLLKSPQLPNHGLAMTAVSTWIDIALYTAALKRGPPLDDSATVDQAIAPDAARGITLEFWLGLNQKLPRVTDRQVDSLADIDAVRVFQTIVVVLPPGADSAKFAATLAKARDVLKRATAGTDFTALVKEASGDSATRAHNGFLPAVLRTDLPKPIAETAFELPPGRVSGTIIRSQGGFHLMRRASREESREALRRWLAPQLARAADLRYGDSVYRSKNPAFAPDSRARIREMSREPVVAPDGPPLVTWTGGALTPALARKWATMLTPRERVDMVEASDSALGLYLQDLVRRELILAIASPEGSPNAKGRKLLAPQFRNVLDSVKVMHARYVGSQAPGVAATTYVDSLMSGAGYRPLPGALSGLLRSRTPVRVDNNSIDVILQASVRQWREKHANDSTSAARGPAPNAPPRLPQ